MQNVHSKKADFFKMHSFEIVEKIGPYVWVISMFSVQLVRLVWAFSLSIAYLSIFFVRLYR